METTWLRRFEDYRARMVQVDDVLQVRPPGIDWWAVYVATNAVPLRLLTTGPGAGVSG